MPFQLAVFVAQPVNFLRHLSHFEVAGVGWVLRSEVPSIAGIAVDVITVVLHLPPQRLALQHRIRQAFLAVT